MDITALEVALLYKGAVLQMGEAASENQEVLG